MVLKQNWCVALESDESLLLKVALVARSTANVKAKLRSPISQFSRTIGRN